jgi:RNA-binding protein YlmH
VHETVLPDLIFADGFGRSQLAQLVTKDERWRI